MFAKLCEYAACRLRMQERDVQVFRAFAWSFVYQAKSFALAFGQSFCNSVLYTESNMVYAMVAFVEPFLYCTVGRCRLKQFQFHLATLEKSRFYLLVGHFFNCVAFKSQHILEIGQSFFNALYGYAQMFNT